MLLPIMCIKGSFSKHTMDTDIQALRGSCFWFEAPWFLQVWLYSGLVCFVVASCCLVIMGLRICGLASCKEHVSMLPRPSTPPRGYVSSVYGPLLDPVHTADSQSLVRDIDELIDCWVRRVGRAAIVHAAFTIYIAVTQDACYTGVLESLGVFILCICRIVTTYGAVVVDRYMSWLSKSVTRNWILVFAICNVAMASSSFVMSIGHMWSGVVFGFNFKSYETEGSPYLCNMVFAQAVHHMVCMVCQTIAAFALFRIQERFWSFTNNSQSLFQQLGCASSMLIVSTFGAGVAHWFSGMGFATGKFTVGAVLAGSCIFALCQELIFGMGVSQVNDNVRSYCKSAAGRASYAWAVDVGCDPTLIGQRQVQWWDLSHNDWCDLSQDQWQTRSMVAVVPHGS